MSFLKNLRIVLGYNLRAKQKSDFIDFTYKRENQVWVLSTPPCIKPGIPLSRGDPKPGYRIEMNLSACVPVPASTRGRTARATQVFPV